jgi:hypothetical protein
MSILRFLQTFLQSFGEVLVEGIGRAITIVWLVFCVLIGIITGLILPPDSLAGKLWPHFAFGVGFFLFFVFAGLVGFAFMQALPPVKYKPSVEHENGAKNNSSKPKA